MRTIKQPSHQHIATHDRLQATLLVVFLLAYTLSAATVGDRGFGWFFLQSLTPLLAACLLFLLRNRFRVSNGAALGIFAHALLMLAGSFFGYQHILGLELTLPGGVTRGCGDWLAHFTVSVPLVLVTRDVLARLAYIRSPVLHRFLLVATCITFATLWELIEYALFLLTDNAFNMTAGFAHDTYVDLSLTLLSALALAAWVKLDANAVQGARLGRPHHRWL